MRGGLTEHGGKSLRSIETVSLEILIAAVLSEPVVGSDTNAETAAMARAKEATEKIDFIFTFVEGRGLVKRKTVYFGYACFGIDSRGRG